MTLRYPNLYLAGAPKCGTTSLFDWLSQHPQIFSPVTKEPILFRDGLSIDHVISESDRLAIYRDWGDERFALEASTHHFYSNSAAREMKAASPDAKVIFALRDPATATHSMYHQLRFTGAEDIADFEAALLAEPSRTANLTRIARGVAENRLYSKVYAYRANIERYLEVFEPEQIKIVLLDDLKSDPRGSLEEIFAWLNIDPSAASGIATEKKNGPKTTRSRALFDLVMYPPRPIGRLAERTLDPVTRRNLKNMMRKMLTKPRASNPKLPDNLRRQIALRHEEDISWLENFLQRDLHTWRWTNVDVLETAE